MHCSLIPASAVADSTAGVFLLCDCSADMIIAFIQAHGKVLPFLLLQHCLHCCAYLLGPLLVCISAKDPWRPVSCYNERVSSDVLGNPDVIVKVNSVEPAVQQKGWQCI
jgi:hypothetical protein